MSPRSDESVIKICSNSMVQRLILTPAAPSHGSVPDAYAGVSAVLENEFPHSDSGMRLSAPQPRTGCDKASMALGSNSGEIFLSVQMPSRVLTIALPQLAYYGP